MMKIAIDPGHGGKDPGAVSGGVQEKDINLVIADKLRKMLVVKGHDVLMTREKDEYISLYQRANKANNYQADIFISIHNNAAGNEGVQGTETLFYKGSIKGEKLARTIQNKLIKKLQRPDRGVKPRDNLIVLKYTAMPAVLIECAFLTNSTERKLLQDNGFQLLIAEGIMEGIEEYFQEV